MRSEDHLALGLYLLSQRNSPQLRRRCIAFLIGCTEPDCNQFSYLRGIVHHRKFRGHNAEHSMEPDCRFIFAACSSLLRQELERIPAEAVQPDSFAARSGFLRRATKKYRKHGAFLLAGLAVGVLAGNLTLKPLIARPRPCWLDESVQLLIANPTDYSFPSGHTLSSVIGATVLTKANRKFGFAAIPLAALIAFSRLYLYVPFPTDILGAAVLGMAIGLLTCIIGDKIWTALAKKGVFLRAR